MEQITRYKLTIEYEGSAYCGFQKQPDIAQKSIEGVLEVAIFNLTGEKVKIIPCGRTDSGVHALGHVVSFDLVKKFDEQKIVSGLNNFLREEGVVALECEIVDENFHARFNAKMRHYRYIIINRPSPLTLTKNRAWHVKKKLDIAAMRIAAEALIGEHDFSSFRDAQCQASSPIRTLSKIEIRKNGEEVFIEFSARSFLHHMVRNIVGTLVWIGIGKFKTEDMKEILESKDRTKSGPNAPAHGLYFWKVDY